MKVSFTVNLASLLFVVALSSILATPATCQISFRINQAGYCPDDQKNAIILSPELLDDLNYKIIGMGGQIVHQGRLVRLLEPISSYYLYSMNFSRLNEPNQYNIALGSNISPPVKIGSEIYKPVIAKALEFFKAQRCGNSPSPYHKSCHLSDVTTIKGGINDGQSITMTGGWHDAGDYTKFLNTTAYSSYLMLLSYEINPIAFTDEDNNGTPDILDEARIGLEWCMKAHYSADQLVIQVQDKTDQTVGWRMPEKDPLENKRPGYNRPSQAHCGITAAALSLGSYVFKKRGNTVFGDECLRHAIELYQLSERDIPNSSCGPDSVYYDETAWDNLALAAIEIYRATGNVKFFENAKNFMKDKEVVHWVSWGDLSGLALARMAFYDQESLDSLDSQLSYFNKLSEMDNYGYPLESYPWGSASIQAGIAMLSVLHHNVTGNGKYLPLAIKQRDFIFGMNSHGISLVSGVGVDYPRHIHHQISKIKDIIIPGAFAAGFVRTDVFNNSNITLECRDRFQEFQNNAYVYHDDYNDYLTNEASISNNAQLLLALTWFYRAEEHGQR